MNQDHVLGAAVTGAPSATVLLANVIQHFQGVDATTAGSEAALALLALGALAGFAQALLARDVPPAPAPAQTPSYRAPGPAAAAADDGAAAARNPVPQTLTGEKP
jgi:hypothetical protein